MIIVDTSAMLAAYDRKDYYHFKISQTLAKAKPGTLVMSQFILAELDYLITTRIGVEAELAMLTDVIANINVTALDSTELLAAKNVVSKYREHAIGIADASMVVLAKRCRTLHLLTLDQRHFRVIKPLAGGDNFVLRPMDEESQPEWS
jgi:uncharacterized protein